MSLSNLFLDMVVCFLHFFCGDELCFDRFASFRHFFNDTDVQVAVDGEREGSWYRGGGHGEEVWSVRVGCIGEFLALGDAETVLFVYDDEGKAFELYIFLYDRVGADDDSDFAGSNPFFELCF